MKRFRDIRESYLRIQERGRTYNIVFNWRGKMYDINMFFPKFSRPSKAEVAFEVRKAYPNAIILYFDPAKNDPTKPLLFSGQEKMNEDRQIKKIIKQLRKSVKSHDKHSDTIEKKLKEESNPRIPRKNVATCKF